MSAVLTIDDSYTSYADNIMNLRYSHAVQNKKESWEEIAKRVCDSVLSAGSFGYLSETIPSDIHDVLFEVIKDRKFIPGGRILSQAGRDYHQTDNCFCLCATDTREGWADLAHKTTMMFMSGGGVGINYDNIRPFGTYLHRSGGIASGPVPLIQMINSIGAAARQGGERRGAIYASLKWDHDDIQQFIQMKKDGGLEHTNISVRFDTDWLKHIHNPAKDFSAHRAFLNTLKNACQYGDPGFQFDSDNQILRNACSEIISADDGDSCCIGSINLAAIDNLQELSEVTELAVLFLLCNTLYTDKPTQQVADVKKKNRRLGLGLMGVAEWFIQRQQPYGYVDPLYIDADNNIERWLVAYAANSIKAAEYWSGKLSINKPVATRAIAPTGTISIMGHTTPGIEPVFHTAYQRTYNTFKSQQHSNGYVKQNIIEPVVQKWIQQGYNVRDIDTAYTLSQTPEGIERRIAFQVFCQSYVDNAISSTVNLPAYVPGIEDIIAPILLRYLPQLRGITFYPEGRHANQPVTPIDINDALLIDQHESCKGDSCGV